MIFCSDSLSLPSRHSQLQYRFVLSFNVNSLSCVLTFNLLINRLFLYCRSLGLALVVLPLYIHSHCHSISLTSHCFSASLPLHPSHWLLVFFCNPHPTLASLHAGSIALVCSRLLRDYQTVSSLIYYLSFLLLSTSQCSILSL